MHKDDAGVEESIRRQYEIYPYPPRRPADETKRLIIGSPSHLDEINHYVFGGRLDFARPFRALIAGGGTGDAAIMLAQQLADRSTPAEVVYLDLSTTSREITEARARARHLTNIRFVTGSLLDPPALVDGVYDYIDCCGVLHHLVDPAAGLAKLVSLLGEHGGIGLMVYGELGRTGVYPVQTMLRMLTSDREPAHAVALARRLLTQLPTTNWLRRNPLIGDHLQQGDAGLYDLLLHSRDRAYRVPEIAELAQHANLRITAFIEPACYDPASYLKDSEFLDRLANASWLDRCAFAELLIGTMRKHICYLLRADNATTPPTCADLKAIPVLRDLDGKQFAADCRPGAALTVNIDGLTLRRELPPLTAVILARIDGRTSLNDIYQSIRGDNGTLSLEVFVQEATKLCAALNDFGKLYLRYPAKDTSE